MTTCVHSVVFESQNLDGTKTIAGTLTLSDNYYTSGDVLNLANYLKSAGSPVVVIAGADGYMLEHNDGTAAAGKVVARYSSVNTKNGANEAIALVEVAVNTDLSAVNAKFIATGLAY